MHTQIQKFFRRQASGLSTRLLYATLLLYHAFRRPETPSWAKHTITGAIAYLLAPIDGIPDLTPFIGFTDDLSVMSFALVNIACYIDRDVRAKARTDLKSWIKHPDHKILDGLDKLL